MIAKTLRVTLAVAALAVAALTLRAQQLDSFPHLAHAKVFPACVGCHAGIVSGDLKGAFPDAVTCNGCHDGQQRYEDRVIRPVHWRGATYPVTNLAFSHIEHARASHTPLNSEACAGCHQIAGSTAWMAVAYAAPAACLACHEHAAPSHLADEARCATCHVPLAKATVLTATDIARFPKPASHEAPDFLSSHAPSDEAAQARCAICHTRESCARCHMTTSVSASALGNNAQVAIMLRGKPAQYPVPASHEANDFAATHGAEAKADPTKCTSCHSRASCTTCHLSRGAGGVVAKMTLPERGGAQGVQLASASDFRLMTGIAFRSPADAPGIARPDVFRVRVHAPGFSRNHRASAATSASTCASCHQQSYCADCHDGAGKIRYHSPDFVQGHGAQAYGREQDCASCHNTVAFCLSCHQSLGLASTGIRNGAVHNQSPNWLIDHGQAARLELPNCISCHKQEDCIRCHSTTSWGINPHGPNFNADRMASLNTQICYYCHVTNPVGRRSR